MSELRRYGPWALVAGASEGLGAAFATALAEQGLNVALVARRREKLEALAASLRDTHGVEARPIALDLGASDLPATLAQATEDLDVGLVVYNAALSPIGRFVELPLERILAAIDVNVRGPAIVSRMFAPRFLERARAGAGAGMVLMSSMSGYHGTALVSAYAATKAFNIVLAEGLWDELRDQGVDVLVSCAGATRTPSYDAQTPRDVAPVMTPRAVAEETLAALGRTPNLVPGWRNRLAAALMNRLLPRPFATRLMGRATRALYAR